MNDTRDNVWFAAAVNEHSRVTITGHERLALDRLERTVVGAASLSEMIELIFTASSELMDCDRVSVAFLEDDARLVSFVTKASYTPLLLDKGFAADLSGSSLGAVVAEGRPRVIDDLALYLEQRPSSVSTKLLVAEGVRSSMTCPLLVDGRAVGVLFRSSRRAAAFGDREVTLHLAVAELLSQAVEKAWRIELLERANRAYTEMLGFVSHELKSPLASIVMDAQVLTQGYLGPLSDPQQAKIHAMIGKADYLLGLIGDYLDLARVESRDLSAELQDNINLWDQVIALAISIVEPQAHTKQVTIDVQPPEEPVSLTADPTLLKIAAVNLLSNAVKYADKDGTVRVKLTSLNGWARLSVWNSGPGFPKDQAGKLFRKFSRLDTPQLRKRKGTGVGLYTTWRIAGLHGGKVSANSEPGSFAEFLLELPYEKEPW